MFELKFYITGIYVLTLYPRLHVSVLGTKLSRTRDHSTTERFQAQILQLIGTHHQKTRAAGCNPPHLGIPFSRSSGLSGALPRMRLTFTGLRHP